MKGCLHKTTTTIIGGCSTLSLALFVSNKYPRGMRCIDDNYNHKHNHNYLYCINYNTRLLKVIQMVVVCFLWFYIQTSRPKHEKIFVGHNYS